ncbi:glycoside hydrolase family 29 [Sphingomonas spermidinifaciens]|uniref:alpha-L-fucosidase n=1 Tax=Sphingomonas spermidinifaciens TaxID=1141889 RepID=A0A2A4B5D5_9SPHN|nr:alpha-L-fucosidase [Sphingomonas spermidinifaciens]PCD03651.1 glycoside hydrolase family 29 [Sphingomonas spermidinifaciens]
MASRFTADRRVQARRVFCRRLLSLGAAAALAIPATPEAQVQTDEQRSAAKLANADPTLAPDLLLPDRDMAWWRDAKFGVFIHWGLYAIPAKGEWHMFNDKVPAAEYAKLAGQFDPQHYDPDAWARIASDAGARYMVMTARHHDGFSLFDSPASYGQYDSMHAAAKRDLIAPFVKAVRGAGLRVGLYYSPLDWRFPAYFRPRELPDNARLLKQQTYGQVEELMRGYGPLDILWYDGGWLAHQGTDADAAWFWEPDKLNRMVRRYQPKIVINPRSGWKGDFDTAEGPGPITGPIRARPWEKTFSISRTAWGYTRDDNVMSADEVIRLIVDAVIRNGNVLANMSPDPDGVVPPKQVETLRGVGKWLKAHGRAVYGTRPGPLQPVDGVYGTTQAGNSVFVHVLSWQGDTLTLPLAGPVAAVRNLSGNAVEWKRVAGGLRLSVPASAREAPVTVLEIRRGVDRGSLAATP